MNTIKCPHCGKEVEIDKALEGQIEARVLAAAHKEHDASKKSNPKSPRSGENRC